MMYNRLMVVGGMIGLLTVALNGFNAIMQSRMLQEVPTSHYTYIADDFPFELPTRISSVNMRVDFSHHYALDDDEKWRSLVPPRHGRVQLGSNHREFGIAMFQQLECLDTIRRAYVALGSDAGFTAPPKELPIYEEVDRCLEVVRQAILCIADTTLEETHIEAGPNGTLSVASSGDLVEHKCHDWEQLRHFVQINQELW